MSAKHNAQFALGIILLSITSIASANCWLWRSDSFENVKYCDASLTFTGLVCNLRHQAGDQVFAARDGVNYKMYTVANTTYYNQCRYKAYEFGNSGSISTVYPLTPTATTECVAPAVIDPVTKICAEPDVSPCDIPSGEASNVGLAVEGTPSSVCHNDCKFVPLSDDSVGDTFTLQTAGGTFTQSLGVYTSTGQVCTETDDTTVNMENGLPTITITTSCSDDYSPEYCACIEENNIDYCAGSDNASDDGHPQNGQCKRLGDETLKCTAPPNSSDPIAADEGGADVTITYPDGSTVTYDTTLDGTNDLPSGTALDTDDDGVIDSVVGDNGIIYPDADQNGIADPLSAPNGDTGSQGNDSSANAAGECVDNPATAWDECHSDTGGDDCVDDPNTIVSECADDSGSCVDDPSTTENECGQGDRSVSFAGCESQPACEGDPLECAMINLSWQQSCAYYIPENDQNNPDSLTNDKPEDSGDSLWYELDDFSIDAFSPEYTTVSASCPPPYAFNILNSDYQFDACELEPFLEGAGAFMILVSLFGGARIVAAGVANA